MKSYQPLSLVKVSWEDAYQSSGWQDQPHEHKQALVNTVGYVVFHDKRGIMLAQGIGEPDADDEEPVFLGRQFVPAGMIRKIKVLR